MILSVFTGSGPLDQFTGCFGFAVLLSPAISHVDSHMNRGFTRQILRTFFFIGESGRVIGESAHFHWRTRSFFTEGYARLYFRIFHFMGLPCNPSASITSHLHVASISGI